MLATNSTADGLLFPASAHGCDLRDSDYSRLERKHGITRATADAAELRYFPSAEALDMLGLISRSDFQSIGIPYFWPGDQHVREWNMRVLNSEWKTVADGNTREERFKYLFPHGHPNLLYVPAPTPPELLNDPDVPVWITEGPLKALALRQLALFGLGEGAEKPHALVIAVTGVWGFSGSIGKLKSQNGARVDQKGMLPDFDRIVWQNRRVFIMYDADWESKEQVKIAGFTLAKQLREGRGAKTGFLHWDHKQGTGIDDHILAVGSEHVLREIPAVKFKSEMGALPSALLAPKTAADSDVSETALVSLQTSELWSGSPRKGTPNDWRQIQVNNRQLRDVSADCLEVLRNSNLPSPYLYVRGGSIVHIAADENERCRIIGASEKFLAGCLTRHADFLACRLNKQGDLVSTAKDPPGPAIQDILSRSNEYWELPPLLTITECPLLRADGSIALTPGYDPVLHSVYIPSPTLRIPNISEDPDSDEIQAAVALVREAIGQFPFLDSKMEANFFGTLLTPILRELIDGNVPVALIDAPQQGTGKGLLAEVLSVVHTGSNASMKPPPKDDEEWRKNLTSVLQAGHAISIFDNLCTALWSPSLALAVTASVWEDRILGQTQIVRLPQRTIFVVTGNNIQLRGDLTRRCYWVRLDAKSAQPWRGRKFKHSPLISWVRKHRGELLAALLTMARGWYAAGCPKSDTPILGSFERWCEVIGGVLAHSGIEGFLQNLDQMYEDADPSHAQWSLFLTQLRLLFPDGAPFTVRDLLALMTEDPEILNSLPDDVDLNKDRARCIGRAFQRNRGRRFGEAGLHIESDAATHGGVMKWRVEGG